jgi:hypothetical protein
MWRIMKRSTSSVARKPQDPELYNVDFLEWTQRTAQLLREGRFKEVDVEHVAEEIEDIGKRDLKEVNSRLQVVLVHLLKWKWQPRRRSVSWRSTLVTQRVEIDAELQDSPSLHRRMRETLQRTYQGAVKRAAVETGLPPSTFPHACPFSIEQALDTEFLPD